MSRKERRKKSLKKSLVWNDNKQRENYTESENNSQELPEQNEQSSFNNRSNRTDEWFFGSRRKEPTSSAQTPQDQIENFINNLDYELIMETYDTFVDTSKQLKPLMKEIAPFFINLVKNSNSTKIP